MLEYFQAHLFPKAADMLQCHKLQRNKIRPIYYCRKKILQTGAPRQSSGCLLCHFLLRSCMFSEPGQIWVKSRGLHFPAFFALQTSPQRLQTSRWPRACLQCTGNPKAGGGEPLTQRNLLVSKGLVKRILTAIAATAVPNTATRLQPWLQEAQNQLLQM